MLVSLFTWHHGFFEAIYVVLHSIYVTIYLVFFTSCLTFCRGLQAFLQRQQSVQVISRRPTLKTCKALQPGQTCEGECGQGVACFGRKDRPAEKHHLLVCTPLLRYRSLEELGLEAHIQQSFFPFALNLFAKNSQFSSVPNATHCQHVEFLFFAKIMLASVSLSVIVKWLKTVLPVD